MLLMAIEELRTKRTAQNYKRKSKKKSVADFNQLNAFKLVLKDVAMRRGLIKYQLESFRLVSDGPLINISKLDLMHKLGNL